MNRENSDKSTLRGKKGLMNNQWCSNNKCWESLVAVKVAVTMVASYTAYDEE
jgi:hypothetical protein